jgi:hypothetical protein
MPAQPVNSCNAQCLDGSFLRGESDSERRRRIRLRSAIGNLGNGEYTLNVWLASPLKRAMEFPDFLEINSDTNYHFPSNRP